MKVPSRQDRERKGRRRPTRRQVGKVVVCAIVFVICLFMALLIGDTDYHATAIGWMPLLAFIALIVLMYAYVSVAARSLDYHESAEFAHYERGDKVPFAVEFTNKGPLVLLNVRAELYVADVNGDIASSRITTVTLGPRATREIHFDVPFEHVGMFAAGLNRIVISDFLGLFERTIDCERTSFICVMPKVPHLGSLAFSDDSDAENFKMLKTALADSLDYAYVRDYEPGDPLKTIHWKLSARTDHYLTRLFEKTVSPGVVVFMDFHAPGENVDESMELRDCVIESALAVADFARSRGLDTEIRYVNRFEEERRLVSWDDEAIVNMVREMPRTSGDEDVKQRAIEEVQRIAVNMQAQNNVVVCSADIDVDMVGSVITARQLRKSPFFMATVPHRLVDRDLERYTAPLAALEAQRIGYHVISRSAELEGREMR